MPHAFGAIVWDYDEEHEQPIGEMKRPRPWRGGTPPFAIGNGPACGAPEVWANGAPAPEDEPPMIPVPPAAPPCCGKVQPATTGGSFSGQLDLSPSCCPDLAWPSTGQLEYIGTIDFPDLHPGDVLPMSQIFTGCDFPFSGQPAYESPVFLWNGISTKMVIQCHGIPGSGAGLQAALPDCSGVWSQAVLPQTTFCLDGTMVWDILRPPPGDPPNDHYPWRFTL